MKRGIYKIKFGGEKAKMRVYQSIDTLGWCVGFQYIELYIMLLTRCWWCSVEYALWERSNEDRETGFARIDLTEKAFIVQVCFFSIEATADIQEGISRTNMYNGASVTVNDTFGIY